jgi:hypothetical protein
MVLTLKKGGNIKNKNKNNMQLKTVMRGGHLNQGLIDLAEDIKSQLGDKITLVEIGSYMGESAEIFAQILPNSKIICIDPFLSGYDELDCASSADFTDVEQQFDLRTANYSNIVKTKGFSTDFKIKCDAIYIDGRHSYEGVKEDILHWKPYVKSIISGHDYYLEHTETYRNNPHIQGVIKAVREVLGEPDKTYVDCSWIKKI